MIKIAYTCISLKLFFKVSPVYCQKKKKKSHLGKWWKLQLAFLLERGQSGVWLRLEPWNILYFHPQGSRPHWAAHHRPAKVWLT